MDFHAEKPNKEVFSSDFRKKSLGLQNPLEFLSENDDWLMEIHWAPCLNTWKKGGNREGSKRGPFIKNR